MTFARVTSEPGALGTLMRTKVVLLSTPAPPMGPPTVPPGPPAVRTRPPLAVRLEPLGSEMLPPLLVIVRKPEVPPTVTGPETVMPPADVIVTSTSEDAAKLRVVELCVRLMFPEDSLSVVESLPRLIVIGPGLEEPVLIEPEPPTVSVPVAVSVIPPVAVTLLAILMPPLVLLSANDGPV